MDTNERTRANRDGSRAELTLTQLLSNLQDLRPDSAERGAMVNRVTHDWREDTHGVVINAKQFHRCN